MNKKKLLLVLALYIFCNLFLNSNVYCENVDIYNSEDVLVSDIVSAETYDCINNVLISISKELKEIDMKLDKARTMVEYENYPLIRLNIDSPYFGISSTVESKLKIKEAVSTLDIAKGYNLRSMLNSKTILVEDFEVTSIVFSTRKVVICDTMSEKDARLCLKKLFEYLVQAELTNKFVDNQLYATFNQYYSKDKKMYIMYINNELNNTEKLLDESLENLALANLLSKDNIILDFNSDYTEYENNLYELKEMLKDPLISEKELESIITSVITLKNSVEQFNNDISEKYDIENDINLNVFLQNIVIYMNDSINFLTDKEIFKFSANEEESSFSYFKYISTLEKYKDEVSNLLNVGMFNNQDLDFRSEKVLQELNKIKNIYIKFLNAYNSALTQYIKFYVTSIKSTQISDLKIDNDLLYVYVDIEKDLLTVADTFEKDSLYLNLKSINDLKQILIKVLDINNVVMGENIIYE